MDDVEVEEHQGRLASGVVLVTLDELELLAGEEVLNDLVSDDELLNHVDWVGDD